MPPTTLNSEEPVIAQGHGRVVVEVIDAPWAGGPARIRWHKRRWICRETTCQTVTFLEHDERVCAPRARLGVRAIRWAIRQLRFEGATIAGLARQLVTTWNTVWSHIKPCLQAASDNPARFAGVRVLGVDEHVWHHQDQRHRHKSTKDEADGKSKKDSAERADADPKAKDHSANGKADYAADSARHGDKTEADKPTSDKSHKEDDAAHHDGDEHPKDTDDKHTTKTDDADSKSTKDEADTHKSDKDEEYEDLYDHSHDKDGPDSSYNPETDPHSEPDPDYDSLPDPSIDQSEGFPQGVDPYRTPPKTRRQLEEALEAWESYQKKVLPDDADKWHSGRYGFDDVVNPERALGYNPDGSPRSMEDIHECLL